MHLVARVAATVHDWCMVTPHTPGSAIRLLREALGISLRDLARAAGISASHLSRMECGERAMPPMTHEHLIAALARLGSTKGTAA